MNGKVLCAKLGIESDVLRQWVKEGLPWTGKSRNKQFDEPSVVEWLVTQGKAEHQQADQIVETAADLCRILGLHPPKVSNWQKDPNSGFPGRPGYYNVEEIDAWLKDQQATKERLAKTGAAMTQNLATDR